ncbi:EamA family transporter [Larkinella soli]|uniref:EamA family transporter n=1 Tax=Larkinella soli TaxID=1770527 RepID=UPI000FFC6B64|nr:EamA family transporter [Larkinella soli]
MKPPKENQLLVILAFAAVYIIWGSTYLAVLLGLETMPPFMMAGLRFFLAGALLFAWCLMAGEPRPSVGVVGRNALGGILMLFGGTGSVIWAEQYIPSGLAAIIVTSLPFWFVILDRRQWSNYFANLLIPAGLLIGFTGVVLLLTKPEQTGGLFSGTDQYWTAMAVLIAGGISWTVGSLYAKYQTLSPSTLVNGSLQLLAAGLFSGLVSGLAGEWTGFHPEEVSLKTWLALGYMIVFGSIIAFLAYLWLLKVRPPAVVSTYAYVNPVIAVMLGWLFAHEPVSTRQMVALGIILLGVLLVNLPKYRQLGRSVPAKQ